MRAFVLANLVFLIACTNTERSEIGAEVAPNTQGSMHAVAAQEPATEASSAASNPRSQYQLADAIRAAEQARDEDERAYALAKIVEGWQGKRYRWSVMFVHAFCPDAERCHVVPFDRGGKDRKIVQGWSPKVEFRSNQWSKVSAGCPAEASRCTLTFEGTLDDFLLSTEELTKLSFAEVEIVAMTTDPA